MAGAMQDPNKVIEELLSQSLGYPQEANTMGKGAYTDPGSGPLGWDYNTLAGAMNEMGMLDILDNSSDEGINGILDLLEQSRASSNDQAYPIIEKYFDRDPHNAPMGDLMPMESEDDEHGYWDAKNMGNGKGQSFQMHNGKYVAADPVGNGAPSMEQMRAALKAQSPSSNAFDDADLSQLIQDYLNEYGPGI